MATDTLDKKKDNDVQAEAPDYAAPIRADILGSIIKSNPNDPGYLGRLDSLVTAHGAVERMAPESTDYKMAVGATSQPRIPNAKMGSPDAAPDLAGAPTGPAMPTLMGGPAKPQQGLLGKIGHGLARMGDIAGTVLAPGAMLNIPGTSLNKRMEAGLAERRAEKQKALDLEGRKVGAQEVEAGAQKSKADTEAGRLKWEEEHPKQPEPHWIQAVNPQTQKPEFYDPEKRQWTGVSPVEKPEADKTPQHITAMQPDGKSHIMERDPKTGEYSIDRGVAPPNYAMVAPGLRTVDVLNQQGIPTIKTLTGTEIGPSATGAYGHAEAQAGAIDRAGTELISQIQKNKQKFGDLDAILNAAFLNTPLADPVSQGLASQIASFAALNPALHGFRGKDALEEFKKLLGGLPNNPEALIAGIKGILKTAAAVNPNLGAGDKDKQTAKDPLGIL